MSAAPKTILPKVAPAVLANPPRCGDCGEEMELRPGVHGRFWSCLKWPHCKGAVGAHPDGRPMGIPANLATRKARIRAHASFDSLWKRGLMSRKQAYSWLAKELGLKVAHMGEMDEVACALVVEAVRCFTYANEPPAENSMIQPVHVVAMLRRAGAYKVRALDDGTFEATLERTGQETLRASSDSALYATRDLALLRWPGLGIGSWKTDPTAEF